MSLKFNDLFNHLLSQHSVSSTNSLIDQSNMGVINLLADTFSRLGFSCEIVPVAGAHEKANLIATIGRGPGGLVLSGHTDTVPFDESLWNTNPLGMTEKDNRLYGLGATDMKGFFAVVHEAVQDFLDADFRQPLIILATADEESSMSGARTLANLGKPKARAAVIGEPTSLRPIHMHKGIMMESIHVQGQSGHSSNPTLGKNALEAMHDVIGALMRFRQELQLEYQNPHFIIDVPTINLGVIHGGDNPNRICGHCDLEFDVRLLPGMAGDAVRESIEALIAPIASKHHTDIKLTRLIEGVEPFDNRDTELVKMAELLTGHSPESAAFGTEGPFLQQLGMDTIILGPGCIDQAHQPDEYMELSQVKPCINILQQLIRNYCL
ncbi:MAG: acetylornithine deacetylase [Gammaproteobacteria bacterium]|jgi:acetylornithine deacetylase|nr:acetylornithine deacetylase [Gammaproteobacteria bacterium]